MVGLLGDDIVIELKLVEYDFLFVVDCGVFCLLFVSVVLLMFCFLF